MTHQRPDNKIILIFVVGGDEYRHPTNIHAPLHASIGEVLAEAKVTGRNNPDEWELKTEDGTVLDVAKKTEDLGLKVGDKIFMSQKVSGGG